MKECCGYIYLLKGNCGKYRIGRTTSPKQRSTFYKQWSKNNHYGLYPVYLVKTNRHVFAEKCLHKAMWEYRTNERHNGMGPFKEWFMLPDKAIYEFLYWVQIIIDTFGGEIKECSRWEEFIGWGE